MQKIIFVFLGGGLGSLFRFAISIVVSKCQLALPIATLISNVVSCSVFAVLLYVYQQKEMIPEAYKLGIVLGFCGGLSTFSTFSYETFELIRVGQWLYAVLNILFNTLLCLCVFMLLLKTNYNK